MQGEAEAAQPGADDEMLIGQPRTKPGWRFFGLGRADENSQVPATASSRALLREALFGLPECKRLLGQVG